MQFLRNALQRLRFDREGALSAEYIAVLVIIAGIVAVIASQVDIGERAQTEGNNALNEMF